MQERIDSILERMDFEDKEKALSFLLKCIHPSTDTPKSTYATEENILFKIDTFFIELKKLTNQIPKNNRFILEVDTLNIVLEELGIEIDKEEAFIFYHMKDLGKFRIKDSKLKEQLKQPWAQNKEYAIDDKDYPRALKNLMRANLIDFRRGNMTLKKGIVLSYR